MGGKYQSECRQCVKELMKSCPDQRRQLFNLLVPGIAIGIEDPSFQHDVFRPDATLTEYPTSKTASQLGPRKAVGGWMTYMRGTILWDPLENMRAFGVAAWGARRGVLGEKFAHNS